LLFNKKYYEVYIYIYLLDKNLDCSHNMSEDGSIGADICQLGLQPDFINMTCRVRFRGNVPPGLLWSHGGTADVVPRDVINVLTPNLLVTSSVILQARDDVNGSQLTCSVQIYWTSSNTTTSLPMNWTSSKLNILC